MRSISWRNRKRHDFSPPRVPPRNTQHLKAIYSCYYVIFIIYYMSTEFCYKTFRFSGRTQTMGLEVLGNGLSHKCYTKKNYTILNILYPSWILSYIFRGQSERGRGLNLPRNSASVAYQWAQSSKWPHFGRASFSKRCTSQFSRFSMKESEKNLFPLNEIYYARFSYFCTYSCIWIFNKIKQYLNCVFHSRITWCFILVHQWINSNLGKWQVKSNQL